MLKKINRLTVARHFKRAYQKGKSVRGRFLSLKAFYNNFDRTKPPKIAVVISKKSLAKATDRNLWRRRTKAIAKEYFDKLAGWEIVVNLNGEIKSADFKLLKVDLEKCFANLLSS